MKTATLEELNEGELIFGSRTAGRWCRNGWPLFQDRRRGYGILF